MGVRLQDDLQVDDDLLEGFQIRVSWCDGTNGRAVR